MNRAAYDNDLLATCYQVHGRIASMCAKAFLLGAGVGCVWYLCVAWRAGVL